MPTPPAIRQRRSRELRGVTAPFVCLGCQASGPTVPRSTRDLKLCATCDQAIAATGMTRCRGCSCLTTNARYCTDCNRERWHASARRSVHASKELSHE